MVCALHGKAIAARSLSNAAATAAVDTYLPTDRYTRMCFFPVRVRLATGKTRVSDSYTTSVEYNNMACACATHTYNKIYCIRCVVLYYCRDAVGTYKCIMP